MPHLSPVALGLLVAITLLFAVKNLFGRKTIIRKNMHFVNALIFLLVFILLGYNFYVKGPRLGLVAVALGAIAVGKYLWDKWKNPEDSNRV